MIIVTSKTGHLSDIYRTMQVEKMFTQKKINNKIKKIKKKLIN